LGSYQKGAFEGVTVPEYGVWFCDIDLAIC
jgi:hypothetical protein